MVAPAALSCLAVVLCTVVDMEPPLTLDVLALTVDERITAGLVVLGFPELLDEVVVAEFPGANRAT